MEPIFNQSKKQEWRAKRDSLFYVYDLPAEEVMFLGDRYNIAKAQYRISKHLEEFIIKAGAGGNDHYPPLLYIYVPSSKGDGSKYKIIHKVARRPRGGVSAPKKELEITPMSECICGYKEHDVKLIKKQEPCVHEIADTLFLEQKTDKVVEEYCRQARLTGFAFKVEKRYTPYAEDVMHIFEDLENSTLSPFTIRNAFYWYLRFRNTELCRTPYKDYDSDFKSIVKAAEVYYEDIKEGYLKPI